MTLHIILPSGHTAVLGTMLKVEYSDIKRYVRMYNLVYVVA